MIKVLREVHEAPESVQEILESYGGCNPYGEPNFRAIWSESRLDWICGKWTEYDDTTGEVLREVIEERHVPKYWVISNRWVIEKWYPPECSPEQWNQRTRPPEDFFKEGNKLQLGPYPARGSYKLAGIVETPDREFLQLTPAVVRQFCWKWEKQRREQLSLAAAIAADKAAHAAVEAAKDARDMDFLNSLASEYGSSAVFQTR